MGQRKADVIGIATAAVSLKLEDGTCRDVRIALGAVAPRNKRLSVGWHCRLADSAFLFGKDFPQPS